ncbi:MAG: STAS-like domain-containing protein [Actinomycetota bacterium]
MKAAIEDLVVTKGHVTSGEAAREAGVTRQAAYYHLRRLEQAGRLRREGLGRASRYVLAVDHHATYPLAGLNEASVWMDVIDEIQAVADAPPIAHRVVRFALTEMVNNAIDHSGGTTLELDVTSNTGFTFRVADDGVGAFRHLSSRLGMDDVSAAFELTKGKRTTDPTRHTGQGIFFTSRIVDRFRLEANGLRLIVDNDLGDFAIGESNVRTGTTVWWEIDRDTQREPKRVFDEYTDSETLDFTKTRVALAALGGPSFISRAEAKRVADGLERFDEVIVDFKGVTDVGHAFADELFRVWANAHPGTRLVPVSTSPVIDRLLNSVIRAGRSD